jgi:iron complex outermembrane receptor protein
MRLSAMIAAVCLVLVGLSTADDVRASVRKITNIPAEGLGPALSTLAKERGFQIVYVSEELNGFRTQGAKGEFTSEEALNQLLSGTGFTFRYIDDKTVTIVSIKSTLDMVSPAPPAADPSSAPSTGDQPQEGAKSDSLRLAQANQGVAQSSSTVGSDAQSSSGRSSNSPQLTEVVVTAQKKTERLMDVPVPVTVLDTQALAENNLNRIQDYYASVPGLNLFSSPTAPGTGTQYLQIRGVGNTAYGSPTVALMIDGVPFGSSTGIGNGEEQNPDIDPNDLARIEVLKGPQGTLYGADSLGGVINFVTQDPSTSAFSGRVQMLGDGVLGGGLGYGLRGSVNIPVSDALAFRVSGFTRQDPGYIENITTGQTNVNFVNVYGGHIAALWHVSDTVSVKVSALVQNTDSNGPGGINSSLNANGSFPPTSGDLQQTGLPGTGTANTQVQAYSATLNAKISTVDVTSVSGYGINKLSWDQDVSGIPYYVGANAYAGNNGMPQLLNVMGSSLLAQTETEKFSEELRFSSSLGSWLNWLGGLFYTHEAQPNSFIDFHANDVVAGAYEGTVLDESFPTTFSEYAIFGDLTFHPTDRFDLQLGARESWNKQTSDALISGIATPYYYVGQVSPYAEPGLRGSDHAFTYLITPDYKISPDMMVYARIASGYQIGGPNLQPLPAGAPTAYRPSTTRNYEVGLKGDTFDHRLTVDASIYYIDWRDIQINVFAPPPAVINYNTNGGRAKSEGIELSLQARPIIGTTISVTGDFDDAELTQNFPPNSNSVGVAGDRLPYSSRFSGTLDVAQDVLHVGDSTGFVGASVSYVGLRYGEFSCPGCGARFSYPAYAVINTRAGDRVGPWNVNLFLNNVANRRGITGGTYAGNLDTPGYFVQVIQPRTVGASVTKSF